MTDYRLVRMANKSSNTGIKTSSGNNLTTGSKFNAKAQDLRKKGKETTRIQPPQQEDQLKQKVQISQFMQTIVDQKLNENKINLTVRYMGR